MQPSPHQPKPRHIALVAYADCQVLDVTGPWQVFASANTLADTRLYDLTLVARGARQVTTNGGLALQANLDWQGLELIGAPDTLLVAGGSGVFEQCRHRYHIDGLRHMADSVRRLGAICSGAFLLAEAGLIDGHRATTHWRHCEELARRYPDVEVVADAIHVEDRGRYTSAGVTAGIDLALSLVEADHGHELAGRVARELVMFLHRPGGQSQFSEALLSQQRAGPRLRPLINVLHATPGGEHDITSMAERLAVTPRHLSRLFQRQLGTSPGEYLTRLRLEAARKELITGEPSLERLAARWRLGGSEQFRRLFQRQYGVSPSIYRARFSSRSTPVPSP
ncbi:GlxA family transcriptional regulator [Halomonas huangheensis]